MRIKIENVSQFGKAVDTNQKIYYGIYEFEPQKVQFKVIQEHIRNGLLYIQEK